jgi:hypothetical protein
MTHKQTKILLDAWDGSDVQGLLQDSGTSAMHVREALGDFSRKAAAREPSIVVSTLLNKVSLSPSAPLVKIPVDEGLIAGDTAEGSEGIESNYFEGTAWLAAMRKSSITLKVSEEQLRADSSGILKRMSSHAGSALARRREIRVVDDIIKSGTKVLDNDVTTHKSSTGRDALGALNGTLVIGDMVRMVRDLLDQGVIANTIVCNPRSALAWWSQPAWREWWGAAPSWQQDGTANLSRATTLTPAGMPSPWKIILSTYIDSTDLIVCNSDFLGEMLIDFDITHQGWKDPKRDLHRNKWSESYGTTINESAVALARNLTIDATTFDFAQSFTHNLTGLSDALSGDYGQSGVV